MFYSKQELQNCLFLDIETKPQTNIPKKLKELWKEKFHFKYQAKELELQSKLLAIDQGSSVRIDSIAEDQFAEDDIFIKYAPLQAEFSEVFCISVGLFTEEMENEIVCICEDTEEKTLDKFKNFILKENFILAGFNIKGFDIPYMIKRFIINNIKLPHLLQLRGKKPWDVKMLDVCEDWKGMGWETSSLDLVC